MPAPSAWYGVRREIRYWNRIPAADLAGVRYREGADDLLTLSKRSAAGWPPTMPSAAVQCDVNAGAMAIYKALAGWNGAGVRHADGEGVAAR